MDPVAAAGLAMDLEQVQEASDLARARAPAAVGRVGAAQAAVRAAPVVDRDRAAAGRALTAAAPDRVADLARAMTKF